MRGQGSRSTLASHQGVKLSVDENMMSEHSLHDYSTSSALVLRANILTFAALIVCPQNVKKVCRICKVKMSQSYTTYHIHITYLT